MMTFEGLVAKSRLDSLARERKGKGKSDDHWFLPFKRVSSLNFPLPLYNLSSRHSTVFWCIVQPAEFIHYISTPIDFQDTLHKRDRLHPLITPNLTPGKLSQLSSKSFERATNNLSKLFHNQNKFPSNTSAL